MPAYNPNCEALYEPTTTCVSTGVPLLKMKVLKKFKKRIGLAANRGSDSQSLPPLLFHPICGDNVRIEENGKVARRIESFCKGVAFSNRPVKIGERVCIKLLEISNNWSGVIRFGFTSQEPIGLRDALPKYVCPDLTNKPGYWAKALSERFAEEGLVLFYYVTSTGDVHFGINGEEKGIFFSGVETRSPIWAMVDVYGNSTAIELLDPLAQLNNRVRIVNDLRPGSMNANSRIIPQSSPESLHAQHPSRFPHCTLPPPHVPSTSRAEVEIPYPQMQHSCVSPHSSGTSLVPYPFHRVKGRNVSLSHNNTVAKRLSSEYTHGYVFMARAMVPGEHFTIQILETENVYLGALAFGMTAANPAGLDASDLPEDCDLLIDRPEYWVVSKDVASMPGIGEELSFKLTLNGEVIFYKSGCSPQVIMHVDHSLQLWPFFDIYGNTAKIKSCGVMLDSIAIRQTTERTNTPPSMTSQTSSSSLPSQSIIRNSPTRITLTVNLPPSQPAPPILNARPPQHHQPLTASQAATNANEANSRNSIYVETTPAPQISPDGPNSPAECTVCYEKSVNSVLYTCGHMCMCYECAVQQWRGRGGGHCPICRAVIHDVIRTYRA